MKKVLVVEDDQFTRDIYIEMLKDEGYQVSSALDGEEGYQAMKNGYDLVLLDIILPKIDGFDILKKLNKEGLLKKNKGIFLLTNLSEESVLKKMKGIRVDGCLIKSDLTPDKLMAKVNSFLRKKSG